MFSTPIGRRFTSVAIKNGKEALTFYSTKIVKE
jgi:hypothetical protein